MTNSFQSLIIKVYFCEVFLTYLSSKLWEFISHSFILLPKWCDAVLKNIQIPIYVFPALKICIWNVYFVCYKAESHIGRGQTSVGLCGMLSSQLL